MTNNDILRRIRYTFDFDDANMMRIFGLAGCEVTRSEVSDWLKPEEDEAYQSLQDKTFALFLNGLIEDKRGKKEGPAPKAEKRLTNNIILNKLKIALNLKAEAVLAVLALSDFSLSKHELSAFFRRPEHKHYRECKDQVLRHFLQGLQRQYREPEAEAEVKTSSIYPDLKMREVDESSVDESLVNKNSVDENSADESSADESSVNKNSVD